MKSIFINPICGYLSDLMLSENIFGLKFCSKIKLDFVDKDLTFYALTINTNEFKTYLVIRGKI